MSFRFRKFDVYQDSIEPHRLIVQLVKKFPKDSSYLANQIKRATLSITLNIAEGSAKNSDPDFRRYIGNALGSINELIAGLDISLVEKLISSSDFNLVQEKGEKLMNQLGSLFQKLSKKPEAKSR